MNTKLGVLALFAGAGMVLLTAAAGSACSSSTGTGGTTTSTGTGTGTTTATGSTTTTTSTSTGQADTCANMCADIAKACTGTLNPFPNNDCATKCATLMPGTVTDTAGNTIGCRIYHAGVAGSSAMNATTHCPHTGIPSIDAAGSTTPGPCS